MKSIVVYYSKSGNTKSIAEAIADTLNAETFQLHLMKKGRRTREEREEENRLFNLALEKSKTCDLLLIGTPTSFKKAHSKIIRFTKEAETNNIGLFCTHYNQIGTTLTDLERILRDRNIRIVGSLEIDNLKPGQFNELDKTVQEGYLENAKDFARECIEMKK
jgi:flavodoxin